MKLKKTSVDYVHQFSDIAFMKFRPKKINLKVEEQQSLKQNLLVSTVKSFIGWRAPSSKATKDSALQRSSSQISINSVTLQAEQPGSIIIFLQKISPEHFLIGNQNQIDLVSIGGIVGNFIDTESLWQLNIGKAIKNVAIDARKGQIAIETSTEIVIYHYDSKKIKQRPEFLTGVKTRSQGKYLRYIRDSVLAVLYSNFIEVYVIQDNKMRRKMCKQIKQAVDMELFQVPMAVQNNLNIFYVRRSKSVKTFQLWYLQMNLKGLEVEVTDLMKVYDVKDSLQKRIKLQNFSKQIFLMNLGFEILAVKKGYIIDSAYLNIQQESTFLHYIGNNRLLHLTPQKAQIYKFEINFTTNPPRIDINSLDSIEIKKPTNYEYIGSLQMLNRNFAVFYQILPTHNKRTKGEISYCFAITKHVTLQYKINEIFTFEPGKAVKDVPLQLIEQKVDMARKIGLNTAEIYLELWNRTNKTDIEQYKFLLDTLNYETIKSEIQKKLKKASLLWRQVYKIEQSCFDMIRENLFSMRCTEKVVKQFLTSHFLLRKLQLYRDISIAEKKNSKNKASQDESNALKINIQNYYRYSKEDIKTIFLQMIQKYCSENKENKEILLHIRIFLKSFRFIFRIIYKQLLEDIISTTKKSLINLLTNLPELLPYNHLLMEDDDPALYQGVWTDISRLQWEKNLHLESIVTIDNREVISEIPNSLWFRRNFLTLHDLTVKTKEQIMKINKSNNSDEIFYFFISKVFEYVKQEQALNKIIIFIQKNYEKMPVHIHEKVFLYRRIFMYLKDNKLTKNNEKLNDFQNILQMKDYQLFREFFEIEKVKKGCLLKDIKEIYEQIGGNLEVQMENSCFLDEDLQEQDSMKCMTLTRGTAWFNEGILSYFSSDLSEISDLKYILNRVNSAKIEFLIENQPLIYVLVKACSMKIRIGSENDVPVQEIMIYLQNIPLTKGSPVLIELTRIQKINQQVQRLQQIKINMTIQEIMKNCESVVTALISQQIKKRKVMQIESMEEMISVSYDILAEIQVIKEKIYTLKYSDLAFFVYLTQIMEQVHMIPYAAQLLKDPYLQQHYSINNLKIVQDLILYMYKMKLSQNPRYIQNQNYLTNLLQILPEDNQCRIYIYCELEYAKLLSTPKNLVEYSTTDKFEGITIVQLEERIQELPGEFLLKIDVQRLHQVMNKMQEICEEDADSGVRTTINEIYETIILKLIEDNLIVQSIELVRKLLQLPNKQYEAIFPLFYINIISQQLTVEQRKLLLRAVSFLFNEPLQLLSVVQELIGKELSNHERYEHLKNIVEKSQNFRKNYNPKNPILDPIYLEMIRNEEMQHNFRNMIDQCGHHLVKNKEQFNTFEFSLLFIMLVQQPYALGKYIFCKRYQINYKVMRSFLSYIIKEEIFSSVRVLEFGRRMFNIVLEASQSFLPFDSIASQYANISIQENIEFEEHFPLQPILPTDDEFIKRAKILQSKLQKCIIAFDKKKISVLKNLNNNGPEQNVERKKQRIQKQLTNPVDLSEKAPSEYPFRDSDDDNGDEQKFDQFAKSTRRKKSQTIFNPSLERNILMNRTSKNYALFMSTKTSEKQNNMFTSARGFTSGNSMTRNIRNLSNNDSPSKQIGSSSIQFAKDQKMFMKQDNYQKQQDGDVNHSTKYQIKRTQSIQGLSIGMSKSAVIKKRVSNLQNPVYSPQLGTFQDLSIEMEQSDGRLRNADSQNKNLQKGKNQQGEIRIFQLQEDGFESHQQSHQQFEDGFKVSIKEIDEDAYMTLNQMKKIILESLVEKGDQIFADFSQLSLQEEKNPLYFTDYLIKLLQEIYSDQSVKPKNRLKIIKQVSSIYPDIELSKQYYQIYTRFEAYHSKYDIPIPINQMFPAQFLFTEQKDPKLLFEQVAQNIVHLVDQSNIYKISKIIHLAFKASSFEHEFFFTYLCMAAQKFDEANISQNELNMQLQKLTALIEKLPINIITERGFKMIQKMKNPDRKNKIITAMVNCCKKKKTSEEVKKFQQKLKKY